MPKRSDYGSRKKSKRKKRRQKSIEIRIETKRLKHEVKKIRTDREKRDRLKDCVHASVFKCVHVRASHPILSKPSIKT